MSQKRHRKEICVYEKKVNMCGREREAHQTADLGLFGRHSAYIKTERKKIYKFTYKHTNTNHLLIYSRVEYI